MAGVAAASILCAIIFITLGVLGKTFIASAFAGAFMVIVVIVYLVGAAKLTKAIGDRNETRVRVVTLTRQIAGVLIFNIVVQVSWVLMGNLTSAAIVPFQMAITNLLMPIGICALDLLLLRFIRRSFARQRTQSILRSSRRATSNRGTRSTASVYPATDFTSESPVSSPATPTKSLVEVKEQAWIKE